MVIDKFKYLLTNQAEACCFMQGHISQQSIDYIYNSFRQNLIDLIVELSQGANVDFDELNAIMKGWR